MTLNKVNKGQDFIIEHIEDKMVRDQAIRLGITEGVTVACSHKLPNGPIILKTKMQEIAIGRDLAKRIQISI